MQRHSPAACIQDICTDASAEVGTTLIVHKEGLTQREAARSWRGNTISTALVFYMKLVSLMLCMQLR